MHYSHSHLTGYQSVFIALASLKKLSPQLLRTVDNAAE